MSGDHVTGEMSRAGLRALQDYADDVWSRTYRNPPVHQLGVSAMPPIYRAMRALEPPRVVTDVMVTAAIDALESADGEESPRQMAEEARPVMRRAIEAALKVAPCYAVTAERTDGRTPAAVPATAGVIGTTDPCPPSVGRRIVSS